MASLQLPVFSLASWQVASSFFVVAIFASYSLCCISEIDVVQEKFQGSSDEEYSNGQTQEDSDSD